MPRKKALEKRIERLKARKASLAARAQASNDAEEVRSINDRLEEINEDIEDAEAELRSLDGAEDDPGRDPAGSTVQEMSHVPGEARQVGGSVLASYRSTAAAGAGGDTSPLSSMEYRAAFMAFYQRGVAIPETLRTAVVNSLPDERRAEAISAFQTGAIIPHTIIQQVINTIREAYGNLYSRVRKVSVPGGVEFPIGALEASFSWISEKSVAPRQSLDKLGTVSFKWNAAEIRISQTFLSVLLSIPAFEAEISRVIAKAYVKAMDEGIMSGRGVGSMLGILNDPRVTNIITMTAADFGDWKQWRKKFFAKLPLGYRAGAFTMPLSTIETYLETMSDDNNNPIYRQATGLVVGDGDLSDPNGRFFGRELLPVEPDIIADFDTANVGDVVGLFWQPWWYAINEQLGFTVRRYYDEETNERVTKAITVVDGKVLNPTGYYKIIKGSGS